MNCKDGCQKERCESLGDMTSLVYEDCMIKYQDDTKIDGGNATKFCVDLYQDLSLWKNELNSYTAAFNERKYSCLKKAGSPNGRE